MGLRVAIFVGMFPVISETFILRQITGLLDLGHQVQIFSDLRNESGDPSQPEVQKYDLLARTTFMDMPPESAPYEMPVRSVFGKTWPPGSSQSISNWHRVFRAAPKWFSAFVRAPRLSCQALRTSEYGYRASSLSVLYRLHKCLAQPRPDLCHAHFGPVGNSFRFVRQLWKVPLIVSFHGYDFTTVPRNEGPDVYRALFRTADRITVNSDFTHSRVEKLGCPPEKIRNLPVGLNPEEFSFQERQSQSGTPFRVLSVGRLVEIKGHEYLIRAVAQTKQKVPDLELHLVGDGPLRPSLTKLAADLGLDRQFHFHGSLPVNEIRTLMARAHVVVLPSVDVQGDMEGQGLALQEAQASGLPVIATTHGALPEGLLPEKSGYLVPERDPIALAERLQFLAEHPELWPALGRAGRAYVEEKYDIRKLNLRLLDIYQEAMLHFAAGSRNP